MSSELRTAPRYFLMSKVIAMIDSHEATVVDLSVKGARLQLTQPLLVGTQIPFAMSTPDSTITAQATVLWCQIAALALDDEETDRYLAGVTFDRPLSPLGHVIDDLLQSDLAIPIHDCRGEERYRVTAPLNASFGEIARSRILDLSVRGARIGMREPLAVGEEAVLQFRIEPRDVPLRVRAVVMWCRAAERRGGFEAGLRIEGEELGMRAVIERLCIANQARVDMNSLRRKFDPMRSGSTAGLLSLVS
jgi:hypothetical protein